MVKKKDGNVSIASISSQAAVWYLLLKDQGPLSVREAWQFVRWLARSRHHVREFMLIWEQDEQLTRLLRAEPDASNVTHVNWWKGSSFKPAQAKHRRHVFWGVAATLLIVLPLAVSLVRSSNEEGTIAAVIHQSKTRRLEDGSSVSLDVGSTLQVNFTEQRRDVHLFQGRATFNVVTDASRPFVVNTLFVDIVPALDSRFSVKIDTSVEVQVYQGVVEVTGRGSKASASVVVVKEGETYRVPTDGFRAIVADRGHAPRVALIGG